MYHSFNYVVRTVFINHAQCNSNLCIGYKISYFRNILMQLILLSRIQDLFLRVKATGTYNNNMPTIQLLTIY